VTGRYQFAPLYQDESGQVSRSPWGSDDVIGRLNWMTPERAVTALSRVAEGPVYDLSVDYFIGMPAWSGSGDPKYEIWLTHTPQGNIRDGLTGMPPDVHRRYSMSADSFLMNTHCGTHIDTLVHLGYRGRFWNGLSAENDMGSRSWLRGGASEYPVIIARGVLLDIAAYHEVDILPASYAITPDDITGAAAREHVELEEGDIVVVRTGAMRKWPGTEYLDETSGIGMDAARLLCDSGAMCVGTDTVAFEVIPPEKPGTFLPVHSYMLAEAGAQIIEILNLEDLSRDRAYEFTFIAAPIRLRGATGSPLRPVGIPLGGGSR
jgi:kynurenine formamidase